MKLKVIVMIEGSLSWWMRRGRDDASRATDPYLYRSKGGFFEKEGRRDREKSSALVL